MATTLNKQSREAIQHAIIHSTFSEREAALIKQAIAVAQRAYEACMPEGFLVAAKSLPKEWFALKPFVDIRIDRRRYWLGNGSRSWELPGARAFPAELGWHGTPDLYLETGKHDGIIAEVQALLDEDKAIASEKTALSATLANLLSSVRTVEKFQEVAPELADYIPANVKQASQRGGLPAVMVGDLVAGLMKAGLKMPK